MALLLVAAVSGHQEEEGGGPGRFKEILDEIREMREDIMASINKGNLSITDIDWTKQLVLKSCSASEEQDACQEGGEDGPRLWVRRIR